MCKDLMKITQLSQVSQVSQVSKNALWPLVQNPIALTLDLAFSLLIDPLFKLSPLIGSDNLETPEDEYRTKYFDFYYCNISQIP